MLVKLTPGLFTLRMRTKVSLGALIWGQIRFETEHNPYLKKNLSLAPKQHKKVRNS